MLFITLQELQQRKSKRAKIENRRLKNFILTSSQSKNDDNRRMTLSIESAASSPTLLHKENCSTDFIQEQDVSFPLLFTLLLV